MILVLISMTNYNLNKKRDKNNNIQVSSTSAIMASADPSHLLLPSECSPKSPAKGSISSTPLPSVSVSSPRRLSMALKLPLISPTFCISKYNDRTFSPEEKRHTEIDDKKWKKRGGSRLPAVESAKESNIEEAGERLLVETIRLFMLDKDCEESFVLLKDKSCKNCRKRLLSSSRALCCPWLCV